MSLKAIVETTLHFESFRNIELFYQGLYFLRCRLYSEKSDKTREQRLQSEGVKQEGGCVEATPYCSFVSYIQMEKNQRLLRKGAGQQLTYDHHNLRPSKIEDNEFQTKTFLIRYCEEEVEINDVALFRAEIEVEPEYLNAEF
jgi:hypothetical protein